MKKIVLPLMIFGLLSFQCKKDKDEPVKQLAEVRGYTNWYLGNFRCGVFVPPMYDNTKKYPLIIYLHGHTDTTTWNLEWYNEPFVTSDPCIVLTPKCSIEEIYGWGNSFDPRTSPMMAKTFEMIDRIEETFNLDTDRYYIYGTSMGGYGTYGVLQKHPDMFAAAYTLCGEPNIEIAPIIRNIPIWIFHGSEDPVVPVQPDRNLYKAVLNLGGTQIRYTEYIGVGHNTWDYTRYETTLPKWFLAQRKGSVHAAPLNVSNFSQEFNAADQITLRWNIPEESLQIPDNKIWYCKIYRDGSLLKEVYNNLNYFVDSTFTAGSVNEYHISAVNYYFKESSRTATNFVDLTE